MAEEATATASPEAAAADDAKAAPEGGFTPITSQEQLNAVLKDRLARERGKVRERYADYDELKERAGAAERLQADLDAANARAEEAEASAAAALRAEAERSATVREVAEAEGVDAELLALVRGETRAELEQAAAVIKARTGRQARYPSVYDGGAGGTAPVSRQDIESIRDPVRRVAARAANAGLYRNSK